LTLLLLFQRERGLCAAAASCTTAVDRVAGDFAHHLQRNHGLAPATVDTYTRVARQFVVWRFGQAEVCLHDLRPSDSIAFVRQESKRMAPPAVKGVAKALRSFLRFCEFRGEVPAGLAASVPSVATWTTTPPIPKAIAASASPIWRALVALSTDISYGRMHYMCRSAQCFFTLPLSLWAVIRRAPRIFFGDKVCWTWLLRGQATRTRGSSLG